MFKKLEQAEVLYLQLIKKVRSSIDYQNNQSNHLLLIPNKQLTGAINSCFDGCYFISFDGVFINPHMDRFL